MPQDTDTLTAEETPQEAAKYYRKFFNEMRDADGTVRPAYKELAKLLDGLSIESLVTKQEAADALFRRLGILQVDVGNAQTGAVLIQNFLTESLHFRYHIGAAFGQNIVHGITTNDFPGCAFDHADQGCIGIADGKQVSTRIADLILHGQTDIDDILVFGQHQRFLRD